MPEADRFEKAIRAGWRGAYRRARDGVSSDAEVADRLIAAAARTLRESGGIPGFADLVQVMQDATWRLAFPTDPIGQQRELLAECFGALDRIVLENEGHRNTKVSVGAAKSLLLQTGEPRRVASDIGMNFAEHACVALVDHYFFATARQNLVAEGKFANHEQARRWQETVQQTMLHSVRLLAGQIVKHPDAKRLRTPPRMVKPRETSELLGEVLTSLGPKQVPPPK